MSLVNIDPRALPTYQEWLAKTHATFDIIHGRGAIGAIDKAYKTYLDSKNSPGRKGSVDSQIELYKELKKYLNNHGGDWGKSGRNAGGNNIIKNLYEQISMGFDDEGDIRIFLELTTGTESFETSSAHSRLGILYLFANITVDQSQTNPFIWLGRSKETVSSAISKYKKKLWLSTGQKTSETRRAESLIKEAFLRFYKRCCDLRCVAASHWVDLMQIMHQVIDAAVCHVLYSIPILGDILKIKDSIVKAIDAVVTYLGTSGLLDKFSVNAGHPEIIKNNMERYERDACRDGFVEIAKNVVKGAINVATHGSPANSVIEAMEFIYKCVMRYLERKNIEKGLRESAEKLIECTNNINGKFYPKSGSMLQRTEDFTCWYSKLCEYSPIFPILTLNSGICGDKSEYINMFNDNGVISQGERDAGVNYWDLTKIWGSRYLNDSGFKFESRQKGSYIDGVLQNAFKIGENQITRTQALMEVLGCTRSRHAGAIGNVLGAIQYL